MSHVTDVILSVSIDEDISAIQEYLRLKHSGQNLIQVDNYAGGGKAVQQDIWMGAFNYLDMCRLEEVFQSMLIKDPECAQLMLKDEHQDLFRVLTKGGNDSG